MLDMIRTSLKDEWQFTFTCDELIKKCDEKINHHKERLTYWQGRHVELRDAYIASVQKAAQHVTDKEAKEAEEWAASVAHMEADDFDLSSNRMSKAMLASAPGGPPRRKEIIGDPELHQELQTALVKVQNHKNDVEAFTRWQRLFQRDPDGDRLLTHSDAVFFGV